MNTASFKTCVDIDIYKWKTYGDIINKKIIKLTTDDGMLLTKESCVLMLSHLKELQDINKIHISLLKEHILDKKVKGEIRIAQKCIRKLKEDNNLLMMRKDRYRNKGIC
jgi:hypothetical protein